MLLPLYILTLGVSAAIIGAFGRRVLATQGYMPDFEAGLVITWGIACAYIAVQLFYMAFLRIAKPTQGGAPLLSESLSHAGALFLVPFLLNLSVAWPYPLLEKVEPLLYLAAFAGVHGFFKLVSLFGATQSEPGGRLGAVGWIAAALVSLYAVQNAYGQWHYALQEARIFAPQQSTHWRAGDAHAEARQALEGAIYTFEMPREHGRNISLRVARMPEDTRPLPQIYLSMAIDGLLFRELPESIPLKEEGWTDIHIPAELVPQGAETCTIMWRSQREAGWIQETGLRPVDAGGREILLSGPKFHLNNATTDVPNFIFLVVDGMGAEHFSGMGYERDTTPALAAFGRGTQTFTHAFTPAPEAMGASMTLLTGVNPLVHGFLGGNPGYTPRTVETFAELLQASGYATAAFTEGAALEEGGDLYFGSGFEPGFELFDDTIPTGGAKATLDKAVNWVDEHRMHRFLLFVRLQELRAVRPLSRYGTPFVADLRRARHLDVYDSALHYVDKEIGTFLQQMRAMPELENTVIVITAPHGLDFRDGWYSRGHARLSEPSLRVPLLLFLPGELGRRSEALVELEDVAPTLAAYAGLRLGQEPSGVNLLEESSGPQVISVQAEPLALSLRNADWRFTWQTGQYPFSGRPSEEATALEFVNMMYYQRNWRQERWTTREGSLGDRYRTQLMGYARRYLPPDLLD